MAENKKISQFPQALVAKDTYKIPILDGVINKIVNWLVLKNDAVSEAVTEARSDIVLTNYYDTGWVENLLNGGTLPDWTNVLLGDDGTNPADTVTHNLNTTIEKLQVNFLLSTDGTDANAFRPLLSDTGTTDLGIRINYVDNNNISIQTGVNGFRIINSSGNAITMDTEAYYYRIIVVKLY